MAVSPLNVPDGVRLWLVRHGATAWSEEGRLCGWSDVPLSAGGRDAAEGLREEAARVLRSAQAVWCSDLRRARETAELAGLPVVPDPRLRELSFGTLEGARWDELSEETRDALTRFVGFSAPGGESLEELERRVGAFLSGLARGTHIVVTHGGVIRLLLRAGELDAHVEPGEAIWLEG